MHHRITGIVIATVVLFSGCSHKKSTGLTTPSGISGSTRNIIVRADLERATGTLYDVIQSMRPGWLRNEMYAGQEKPVCAYLDGIRLGTVGGGLGTTDTAIEQLRGMQPLNYVQVRYWDVSQAVSQFVMVRPEQVCSVIQAKTRL